MLEFWSQRGRNVRLLVATRSQCESFGRNEVAIREFWSQCESFGRNEVAM